MKPVALQLQIRDSHVMITIFLVGAFSLIYFASGGLTFQEEYTSLQEPLFTSPLDAETSETEIISGPAWNANISKDVWQTITFDGHIINQSNNNSIKGFECNFNNQGWHSCDSPFVTKAHSGITEYTLEVRAIDKFGKDPTPAVALWRVQ